MALDADYQKLGLRVGLEIHQQLSTKYKLFCHCPLKKSESFDVQITRKMRAVPSELGGYDPAALYEYLRDRSFVYKFNDETTCLVEIDEQPPKQLNEEALHITLQVCKLLRCSVLEELHVMRKTVIDGSTVSGFQRTVLVGVNGSIDTNFGSVGILRVSLEEDSAPVVARENGTVEYRLDRVGIPLVEIATTADIHTPEQARAAAESIGLLLRSTKVVRGIGSIRQDINISITRGARIEIKGFQELEKMPRVVENEVQRQLALLEIKEELERRGVKKIAAEPRDVTDLFKNTRNRFLRRVLAGGGKIFAISLSNFAGLLAKQCGDRSFGKELAGCAEAYGHGIIDSDEDLRKYELENEFASLRAKLGAGERDLLMISAGANPQKALRAVAERVAQCLNGVPEETRVADGFGSKYTRPLPGAERMYPESDVPPIKIDSELLAAIEVPKTLVEKEKGLERELPHELARAIVRSRYFGLYTKITEKHGDHVAVATTFVNTLVDLKRRGLAVEKISDETFEELFSLIAEGKIAKKSTAAILEELSKDMPLQKTAEKYHVISEKDLRKTIRSIVEQKPGLSEGAYMGLIMERTQGRADGALIAKLLREEIKQK